MRSYLVQNILWNSTHKPLLIHTKASIDSMGKVASCPTSELDIIHTLLEFRQTREFVTLDREPSQQALRWSCRKVQLSAVCFSRCLCVQIVFSTMWWVPASSLTPICVCVCVCTEGWITLLTVPGTSRTRPREPSPLGSCSSSGLWELGSVCPGRASRWRLLGYNWFLWRRLSSKL